MKIIFFGNRGSKPLGASECSPFAKYGGDTTSVGVTFEDGTLIALDAGSGFWKWPYTLETLMGRPGPYNMHLFLSHFHDDHMMGLPQSPLLFNPRNNINIYGPDSEPGLKAVFEDHASRPHNPNLSKHYNAALHFTTLHTNVPNRSVTLENGAKVSWLEVPHGDETALGFRIDYKDESFVMISDTHHEFAEDGVTPVLDPAVVEFVRGANALVYDSHFSDEELNKAPYLRGFGHSTGEHGVRLSQAAGVPLLITHHHNPNNTDDKLDEMTRRLRDYGMQKGVYVMPAQPSLTLDLSQQTSDMMKSLERQDTPKARYAMIGTKPA